MGCRGVHYALDAEQEQRLLDATGADRALIGVVHGLPSGPWSQETDKAWYGIDQCLLAATTSDHDAAEKLAILGGRSLFGGDGWIVCHVPADDVINVAAALASIDRARLHEAYDAIDSGEYDGFRGEDDFDYIWGWFQPLREFYARAANARRSVIFTADQ